LNAHLPILIVVVPLLAAGLVPLAAFRSVRLARGLALGALTSTVAIAMAALARTLDQGRISYHLGGWAPPWGIEYVIDPLSGGVAVLVAAFGLVAAVYAGPFLAQVPRIGAGAFHAVYLLLVTGLLGIVVTGDLFNLYVFLEISSLAVYALIALGGPRGVAASFRYLLLGTVAGSFYLLGVGYLYALTGTLNMADMAVRLAPVADSPAVTVAVALMVVGLAIKMGLFPLHGWLPDAYTFAPAPVTGLIAAVMTKVSVYALFRILFYVVDPAPAVADALQLLGWVGALAIVAGSAVALAQTDVRRMLAYSSVGQMGYIVMGIAIGTPLALTGALLHMLNHAVMKGCLFLAAGGVRFQTGAADVASYSGAARRLPISMAAFSVAAVSLVGLPPTGGFFSKWYLLVASVDEGLWAFALALVASSLMTAVYLFRVVERAYFGEGRPEAVAPTPLPWRELPASMLAPIVLLGGAVLLLGLFNQRVVTGIIALALPAAASP
jgi:multicomponent Na+:H+ antiporter subunit D